MKTMSLMRFTFTALLTGLSACGGGAQPKFLSIATGGSGGVYFPYGGALAKLISDKVPGVQATAEVTNASVDNLKLMQLGKVDLAFTLADTLAEAVRGQAVQGDGALGHEHSHRRRNDEPRTWSKTGAGIASVADLLGKMVPVGAWQRHRAHRPIA
jgi:TRAP transporter TAXI family solute receptor